MLLSELEERKRRFTLALRAGIPVLFLVFLVFYSKIYEDQHITISIKDGILLLAITFISVYFIYFLMDLSVKETMLDETTHGFNKRTFIKKLRDLQPTTLASLHINNLSSLNKNYSIDQVDTLLYSLAKKLHLAFKQEGIHNVMIGRHNGSEFLIALNHEYHNVEQVLEKMVNENRTIDNIEVDYQYAVITNTDEDYEKTIIQLQDIINSQLNDTKKQKKTPSTQDAKALTEVEQYVISAIKNRSLLLSFRPMLNTQNDTIDTYEIAVKLKCPSLKDDILPRIYLPIINRLGLGREYDFTLVKHVIDLLPLVDKNISFTFNLSPFSLRDKGFQEKVFNYLLEKEVDPSRLIIQLYERKAHHNLGGYLETLKKFRARGIQICIDNFGSSNASMEYMKHFKFDMVQFDRDFVTDLENETTYAMLDSLIKMSKSLQVKTVAKWVDNDEQKKKLKALGINYIQGFGVSKAISEDALINRYN
jgi:EAL domain-containing protein (putative c-di-GMP-specific phosphodiesterase class I)/GGDEF domain-containing protein